MGINKLLLGAALIATLVAIPISKSIQGLQDGLDIQRLEKAQLELKIEKKETQAEKLEKKIEQIKADTEKTNKEKDKEIEKLKRDLLAKKEREEKERLRLVAAAEAASVSEPDPTPTRSVNSHPVGCENYRGLVSQYSWNVDVAMNVMYHESGCNPSAANMGDNHSTCTGSFGLFQLACFHTANPTNPVENVAVAHRIWSQQGWGPWGVCTNGSVHCY